jgi:hypothetical protein
VEILQDDEGTNDQGQRGDGDIREREGLLGIERQIEEASVYPVALLGEVCEQVAGPREDRYQRNGQQGAEDGPRPLPTTCAALKQNWIAHHHTNLPRVSGICRRAAGVR